MIARSGFVLFAVLACACGGGAPEAVVVKVGAHELSFVVPAGWQHYDHGREQRLETSDGDIVITDFGPVAGEGYRQVVVDARELYRKGLREDAQYLLRGLHPWRGIDDEKFRRAIADDLDPIYREESGAERTFASLLSRLDGLPQPNLGSIANEALLDVNHDSRRDIERREKLVVDGRDARRIVTWQRLTHDHRRHHVFILNRGNLLVVRTDVGIEAVLEPAFSAVVGSLSFDRSDSR